MCVCIDYIIMSYDSYVLALEKQQTRSITPISRICRYVCI